MVGRATLDRRGRKPALRKAEENSLAAVRSIGGVEDDEWCAGMSSGKGVGVGVVEREIVIPLDGTLSVVLSSLREIVSTRQSAPLSERRLRRGQLGDGSRRSHLLIKCHQYQSSISG